MLSNELPKIDMEKPETGCCPRFIPEPWDQRTFVFDNKLFVKANTISFMHIPINMEIVYPKIMKKMEQEKAFADSFVVLSFNPSPWKSEHYFAANKDIPGEEMVKISGKFITKVFEGPFSDAKNWVKQAEEFAKSKSEVMKKLFFFYTTCPKCSKSYGKNYVVGFIEV